jgi:hypothetical protein
MCEVHAGRYVQRDLRSCIPLVFCGVRSAMFKDIDDRCKSRQDWWFLGRMPIQAFRLGAKRTPTIFINFPWTTSLHDESLKRNLSRNRLD